MARRIHASSEQDPSAILLLALALAIVARRRDHLFVTGTVTETFYIDQSPFPGFPAEGPFVELVRDMTVGDTFQVTIDYRDVPCDQVFTFRAYPTPSAVSSR